MQLDIDGFARPVVKGLNQAGLAHQDRAGGSFCPAPHRLRTYDILAGDVVDFLGEKTHKIHAPTRANEQLKFMLAQIVE